MPNTSISFPASPTVNQQYTYGTTTYVWTGTEWMTYINSANLMPTNPAAMNRQMFSGTGSQTVFTLASDPGALGNGTVIYINGVYQQKNTYTTSGTTLTFTEAPPAGTNNIEVVNFVLTNVTTTNSDFVNYVPAGAGAVARTGTQKFAETISVKDFGAVGDGVADDTAAINAALASGAKRVHLPAGTYKVGSTLSVPQNVSMYGDGPAATIIDGSAATYANLTNGVHIEVAQGTWTALPAISTDPVAGASAVVFASAPSVVRGDVILIYNPTNGSWNPARTYYRAGEMQRVAALATNTVTTQGSLFAGYTAANVNAYKLTGASTFAMRDFTLKGLASTANPVTGIRARRCFDCVFDNVKVTDCSYSCIDITNAYNLSITNCMLQDDASSNFGGDYGLAISNSMSVAVNGGTFYGVRHAITTGGADEIGAVTNRLIKYANLTAMTGPSTANNGALDFHGNCEYCMASGCTIDGGLIVGGDHITVEGCTIIGRGSSEALVLCSELRGTSISFLDNMMQSFQVGASGRGTFIDIGGNSNVITTNTQVGGIITIANNTMECSSASTTSAPWARINNTSYTGTDVSVAIEGNAITCAGQGGPCLVECTSATSGAFAFLNVSGNVTKNCGLIRTRNTTAANYSVKTCGVSDNTIVGATGTTTLGIFLDQIENAAMVTNNLINGCSRGSVYIHGPAGLTGTAVVQGNTIIDGLLVDGSADSDADIIIWDCVNAACINNVYGSANANRNYGLSFDTVTNLLLRDNTPWQSANTGNYVNAITAYLPGSVLSGSATYDPPNLIDGAGTTTTVTVTGAALGDLVECVSFSLDLQGITVTGYVSAANTVSVRFQNESGGTLDLGSGTLLARVRKA